MGSLGLAIISKNEEGCIGDLLDSIEGAFDRVVLLDTGSTDGTIDLFSAWAKSTGVDYQVGQFEWCDDFAAARNAADRLLLYGTTEAVYGNPLVQWRSWADCDDILKGARNLRDVCETATDDITAFFASYNYAQDESGKCVVQLHRERLVRTSYTEPWVGRVHEATPINAGVVSQIPDHVAEWTHCKQVRPDDVKRSNLRNLEILKRWNEEEPGDTRVVGYLGVENMVAGNIEEAMKYFHEYNALGPTWKDEHAQVNRKLAQCYLMKQEAEMAQDVAFIAMKVQPNWPDSYITMAEACYILGEHDAAVSWAKRVLALGPPNTMLIINPQDYTVLPKKIMALALGDSGDNDKALELAHEVLALEPGDDFFAGKVQGWQDNAKRERTANTITMMAEQLVHHDEQWKAKLLLEECVPYFAQDHPKVVNMRSYVRERLQWVQTLGEYAEHYETGGSKPEDFIPEDKIDKLCEYLPRTNFLLEGLREQREESQS